MTIPNSGENVEQQEFSFVAGGNVNTATSEDSLAVSYKSKRTLTIQSSNCTPWYLPKETENLFPHKNLHIGVYSSFIHNYQNLDATKVSFSG